jgi:NAD(P)-dependent dehydrogenase (short-subunit alcohol dehydrogenase family)
MCLLRQGAGTPIRVTVRLERFAMGRFESDTVLITDASRGIGAELVSRFLHDGVRRVYAASPDGRLWPDDRVVAAQLDCGDDESLRLLKARAPDVTVVVHTASSSEWPPIAVGAGDLPAIRAHLEASLFGALRVASAFTPVLAKNEGGVFAVLISVQAWINLSGGYSVAQAALWSVTNALRTELAYANVHVLAGMVGLALSDETGNPAHPATDPASVAESLLAAIDAREYEVVFDAYTASVKQRLAGRIEQMYPELR